MNNFLRWQWLATAGLALVVLASAGCQTWVPVAGLTLPSGHYLDHPPQYIPTPQSEFTLPNELAAQEEAALVARAGGGGGAP